MPDIFSNSKTMSVCTPHNILPAQVQIEKIRYQYPPGKDILVTDGSEWRLELSHL
jgi:hypothetical protein